MMIFKFSVSIPETPSFLAIAVTGAAQLDLDSFQMTSIN